MTGIYGNQLLFTVGLSKTSADVASIFQPAIPVFAALVAMVSGLEPPIWPKSLGEVANYTMRKIVGILLAVLGSMIMVGFSNLSHGQGNCKRDLTRPSNAGDLIRQFKCTCRYHWGSLPCRQHVLFWRVFLSAKAAARKVESRAVINHTHHRL